VGDGDSGDRRGWGARRRRWSGPSDAVAGLEVDPPVAPSDGQLLSVVGPCFQRAPDIWRRAGSDPEFVAYALTGLGRSLLGQDRFGSAVPPLERALAIRIEKQAAPKLTGETRFALARALWSRDEAHPRAIALATAARTDDTGDKLSVAEIDAWLDARVRGRVVPSAPSRSGSPHRTPVTAQRFGARAKIPDNTVTE
jgi:hypothetical protein